MIQGGLKIQGELNYSDRQVPSLRGRKINNKTFDLGEHNFIAPNTVLVGDITLSKNSSVWFGATLNADYGSIIVGENSQIQDNSVLLPGNGNIMIGKNVTVGSNCTIASCFLKDGAHIGVGSSIGQGCVIEEGGFIAAGSVVTPGTTVGADECWAGNPAEKLRIVTPDERENIQEQHAEYIELAGVYAEHTERTFRDWLDYHDDITQRENQSWEEESLRMLEDAGLPTEEWETDYTDARFEALQRMTHGDKKQNLDPWDENPDVFSYEYEKFPEALKMYKKNYESYEDSKKYFEQKPTEYPTFREGVHSTQRTKNVSNEDPWTKKWN